MRVPVGRSGTSLVEILVSIVLLGLAATLSVRVLSDAARSLDAAELGFRALLAVDDSGPDAPGVSLP